MRPEYTPKQIERFWSKVDRSDGPDACWPWTASFDGRGYGQFAIGGRNRTRHQRAHRVAFFLTYGFWPEPNGCHTCDNPPCCNPKHIYEGTHADNMRDKVERNRTRPGDQHWMRFHPERIARGDRHGARTHPELIPRGEQRPDAKLTNDAVRDIRQRVQSGETHASIAASYGVGRRRVGKIMSGQIWKHVEDAH